MISNNLKTNQKVRSLSNDGTIVHECMPVDYEKNTKLTTEQKTQLLINGANIVNRVMDIVKLREDTDASLKRIDKDIAFVERTTKAEISKMMAQTESWEKKFEIVSKVLREMTITVTTNKDLHPDIAKALIDTVKAMVEKISIGE